MDMMAIIKLDQATDIIDQLVAWHKDDAMVSREQWEKLGFIIDQALAFHKEWEE